jgi:hypothetical protein
MTDIGTFVPTGYSIGANLSTNPVSLLQIGDAPTVKGVFTLNNGKVAGKSAACIYSISGNGGSTLAALEPVVIFGREGVSLQSWANFATVKIGRYEDPSTGSGYQSRTAISLCASHENLDAEGNASPELMRWLSGGWTIQNLPTTAPTDSLIADGQCTLINNGGVPTLRSRSGSTYTNTPLGSGSGPYAAFYNYKQRRHE